MATLNIEDLPDDFYEKLKARAKRARRSVAQEVISLLAAAAALWQDADAAAHVETERAGWD